MKNTDEDTSRELQLEAALEYALVIIAGEFSKYSEYHAFAVDTAKRFDLDIGEMG